MKKLPQKGFTLVELMVVVAIIAVLTVIGIIVFGNIQQKARDSRRRADIDSIAKVLEAHYNDTTCGATTAAPYCNITGNAATLFSNGKLPVNPSPGGAAYTDIPGAAVTTFNICATLEVADPVTGATYCRKNQQ